MFGRRRTIQEEQGDGSAAARPDRPGAKNRPTPKRRDQEAKRRQPLVQTDRKAARAAQRESRREAQSKARQAMVTGDDRYLPARDRGPQRRFVRDYVDARRSIGEYVLPLMVLVLLVGLFAQQYSGVVFLVVYGVLLVAIVDAVLMWRRIRAGLQTRFGEDVATRGLAMYAVMRAFQIRRTRMPKPLVERGEYPH